MNVETVISPEPARITPPRNIRLRGINPLAGVRRQRPENEDKIRSLVPLVNAEAIVFDENGVEQNRNDEMDSLWIERVVTPIKKLWTGFGLGPNSLMITSIFGPFNARKEPVTNHLVAEYDDIRIFYDGRLMSTDHLVLFASLLNIYVLAPDRQRTRNNCVTIDRDELIVALYGDNLLRGDGKGGRPAYYDETVSTMLGDLRNSTIRVIEGGDNKGTVGKGKGYLASFLRELSWNQKENTFTFSVDYRVANLYALNGHTFIYLRDRHEFLRQTDVDEVTLSLNNLFRTHAREPKVYKDAEKEYKDVSFDMGDLMIRFDALGYTKKAFVDRIIQAVIKIKTDVMQSVEISGLSLEDLITMSSRVTNPSRNLIGRDFVDAKKIIEETEKDMIRAIKKRRKLPMAEKLASYGLLIGSRDKQANRSEVAVSQLTAPAAADDKPVEPDLESVEITPAKPVAPPVPKTHARGLRGKYFDSNDKPIYYIRLKNFVPGYPHYETLADHNGGYPIYESWIKEAEALPSFTQAGINSVVIGANIQKACIWSEKNVRRRKTVAQLDKFLSDWIARFLDEKDGGGNYGRAGRETAVEKSERGRATAARVLAGLEGANEKEITPTPPISETGFSGQIYDNE